MINSVARFVLTLAVVLAASFGLHGFTQHQWGIGFFERHIVLNYGFNFVLASTFYTALVYFQQKKSNQLGFIFMGTSLFKFLLFFMLLYPDIKDSPVKLSEAVSFFIPYGLSLLLEVRFLVKMLNPEQKK